MNTNHANIDRFSGFADTYDAHRPSPPGVLVDVLTQLAEVARPRLVVDLGSGTGKSTRVWIGRADRVIGIEPNADMRRQAEALQHQADGVLEYRDGTAADTGLPDACADILTCCQSFHWMEPASTLAEVARVLRPGGVFAAVDCDWPPVVLRELDDAYRQVHNQAREIEKQRGISSDVRQWPKEQHLKQIKASGRFRYAREITLHQVEPGDAQRLVGIALSQGGVAALLRAGISEDEIGLAHLRALAERLLGGRSVPFYFSYRVRVGVK